jgi:LPXTG-motif cell wall-anchored protein
VLESLVPGRTSSMAFIGVGLLALLGGLGGAVRRKQD